MPLTPAEFIQRILVPEAALRLVMEDMHQSRKQAIRTLRESAQYGVAMFPDEHSGEGYSASEEIVKARAAARRKQLQKEDEDEEEAELWSAFPDEDFGDIGAGKLSRAPSHASVESSRPRRACAMRAQSIIDDSDSDISMGSSKASTASKSRKSRAKPSSKSKKAGDGPAKDAQRAESVEILSETDMPSKRRPRPRPKVRDPNTTDVDVNLLSSGADLDWSDAPLPSQQIEFGARGRTKRVPKNRDRPPAADLQQTPKANKVGRLPVGSSSSFALQVTKTRGSSG